jgi:23S rRNA pseudouridine1911/1915/1917 synthase
VGAAASVKNVRIVVDPAHAGQRLDQLLASSGAVVSRSRAQALLRDGLVHVHGVPRKASYVTRVGDVVDAAIAAVPADPRAAPPRPEAMPLDILYEDDDVLAINKAAGVVVHPAPGNWEGTLVNAVVHHLGAAPVAGDALRPGIVHRLDKDTSGVLLVAKTPEAHVRLGAQFRDRTVQKRYVAVVRGRVSASEGTIDRPIGRHPSERKRMSVRTRRGRLATTRFRVVERYTGATLVSLVPTTGRTHQLRVHLAAIGHPIVGDRLYGRARGAGRSAREATERELAAFPRQALHAEAIVFAHPRTGSRVEIRAPLAADLRGLLSFLKGAGAAPDEGR